MFFFYNLDNQFFVQPEGESCWELYMYLLIERLLQARALFATVSTRVPGATNRPGPVMHTPPPAPLGPHSTYSTHMTVAQTKSEFSRNFTSFKTSHLRSLHEFQCESLFSPAIVLLDLETCIVWHCPRNYPDGWPAMITSRFSHTKTCPALEVFRMCTI